MIEAFLSGSFWRPLIFLAFAFGTVLPAIMVVVSRNIVHSALWLLTSLAAVAGLYLLLDAELLAALQILVYCGGIMLLFLFAIMLTPGVGDPDVRVHSQHLFWGLMAAMALAAVTLHLLRDEVWISRTGANVQNVTGRLAEALVGQYALAFEAASVVLLVAMVGAIVIVRGEPKS